MPSFCVFTLLQLLGAREGLEECSRLEEPGEKGICGPGLALLLNWLALCCCDKMAKAT